MSMAVARMAKMKAFDLKGMQFHNQRERESRTNPDIDKERSAENYDLVNKENIDYNERVAEIIDSQKTGTRKTRKDAVLVNELLITSDKEFFDNLSSSERERYFEESYKLFAERYGKQNIAYATVHLDEKTPHMHLGIVPMKDGRLQGKNVFNRKELLWIQEEFPKHMKELGFDIERGEKGSERKHLDTAKFKLEQTEKQLGEKTKALEEIKEVQSELEQELKSAKEEVTKLKDEIQLFKNPQKVLDKVKQNSKPKKKMLGSEVVSYDVPKADFEKMNELAKSSVKATNKLKEFAEERKDLKEQLAIAIIAKEKVVEKLSAEFDSLQNRAINAEKEYADLQRDTHEDMILYKSILQDKGESKMPAVERNGRLVLHNLENGHVPKTEKETNVWLSVLNECKEKGYIPKTRLEGFISLLKEFLSKILSKDVEFNMSAIKSHSAKIKQQQQPKKKKSHDIEL